MSASELAETIQWVLKNDTFIYDKLDLAVHLLHFLKCSEGASDVFPLEQDI